ncbi:hypothetical protein [Nocardia noduli]|uniref:hypothetical protein n=1 Tax=Nocardia noduli TaxID=2815722 RepID=UPI001C22F0D5|nr:hypothetical protein [Nocardia noduli]
MLDSTPNPSITAPISSSSIHAISASDTDLRLQFCRGDADLTAHPGSDTPATEVRLWDHDVCLAAVTHDTDGWAYAGGDHGHRITDEHLHARFADWHEALHTLTGLTLPPA